ncbi:acyl-CoA dehydrogenase [Apiospora arundinis]
MSAPDDVGSVEIIRDLIIVNTQSTQSSQSNNVDSRPTSPWATQPVEPIELVATLEKVNYHASPERAGSLEPVIQPSPPSQQRNRKQYSTRHGRATAPPRFKFTSEIRGLFMERVLDAKRDSMLTIARAGEMKKAFEHIADRMKESKVHGSLSSTLADGNAFQGKTELSLAAGRNQRFGKEPVIMHRPLGAGKDVCERSVE